MVFVSVSCSDTLIVQLNKIDTLQKKSKFEKYKEEKREDYYCRYVQITIFKLDQFQRFISICTRFDSMVERINRVDPLRYWAAV